MFGKLVYGQFSLKETFWKFGVLGLFTVSFVTKLFGAFLKQKINGMSIKYYYTHYFSMLNIDNMILFLTIAYFVCFFALVLYSVMVWFGVWRSAKEYDKSAWLGHISKLFILFVIYGAIKFALI
ncbi:MAG: hypothetical protein IJW75_02105 [Alphaproteobacteria bacterium]|nr:hypothetical protein [Alphaproteobacteria bacterium]